MDAFQNHQRKAIALIISAIVLAVGIWQGLRLVGEGLAAKAGNAITVNQTTNDFGTLTANGANITVAELNDLTVFSIAATGNITLTANGNITQTIY